MGSRRPFRCGGTAGLMKAVESGSVEEFKREQRKVNELNDTQKVWPLFRWSFCRITPPSRVLQSCMSLGWCPIHLPVTAQHRCETVEGEPSGTDRPANDQCIFSEPTHVLSPTLQPITPPGWVVGRRIRRARFSQGPRLSTNRLYSASSNGPWILCRADATESRSFRIAHMI